MKIENIKREENEKYEKKLKENKEEKEKLLNKYKYNNDEMILSKNKIKVIIKFIFKKNLVYDFKIGIRRRLRRDKYEVYRNGSKTKSGTSRIREEGNVDATNELKNDQCHKITF